MKLVGLVFAVILIPAATHADRVYMGSEGATHDCSKDAEAVINGGAGTYTFTGTCDKIAINGGENKVTIEAVKKLAINGSENAVDVGAADKIAVNGSENKVTYKKGIAGAKPKVATIGTGNRVSQVK